MIGLLNIWMIFLLKIDFYYLTYSKNKYDNNRNKKLLDLEQSYFDI